MSKTLIKKYSYQSLNRLAQRLRDDLRDSDDNECNFVLLYAYNGTGKTRLSMEFKNKGKKKITRPFSAGDHVGQPLMIEEIQGDTLYFNAFTEDLFSWDNDLENDSQRALTINADSKFFAGFKELALEERIFKYLERYATFDFKIDYENWRIIFSQEVQNLRSKSDLAAPKTVIQDHIKVSRGEENIFIWCIYLAICELVLEGAGAYHWVKFLYIDDPVSSLDDNNTIAIATDLAKLLIDKNKNTDNSRLVKAVISSHHGLFFNVICNEFKKTKHKTYFMHCPKGKSDYTLQATTDTPFFHHVATLSELKKASETGELYTYHFNALRSILEKTAAFLGQDNFSFCLDNTDDALYSRALNLLSHGGGYSLYQPRMMVEDNKKLFTDILNQFLNRFEFVLPEITKK